MLTVCQECLFDVKAPAASFVSFLTLLMVGGADGVGDSVKRSPNHPPVSPDGCSCRFPGVLANLCGDLHSSRINFYIGKGLSASVLCWGGRTTGLWIAAFSLSITRWFGAVLCPLLS
jgi:hypothetical protein